MHFKLAHLVPLLAFGFAAATPLEPRIPVLTPVPSPLDVTPVSAGPNAAGTLAVAATVLLCQGANCASGCYRFSLTDRPYGTCYNSIGQFVSLWIDSSTPGGEPYAVTVGNVCPGVTIPAVNRCYSISPAGTVFSRISGWTPVLVGGRKSEKASWAGHRGKIKPQIVERALVRKAIEKS
ncbi:hypothetical protein BOTBODRAFT_41644 [Botryobasidium botryosum FD-172 SS1]|uniref:Uncharacterized protein n=1 Tax=Botryobasidium botryosum (strain FD-172 SS1) TaxID=930990 RepID=A0A067N5M8_BOTB1|nr:hypothetical protein BOTBODRAFT_41644 [Botryobasidium botryosum FD-172 SS1]